MSGSNAKGAWVRDYNWRPRTAEESVDPGVHPVVAKMRLEAGSAPRTLEDCMSGKTLAHVLNRNKAPDLDMGKVASDPSYNPKNFFKQANKHGVNPLEELTKGDTVSLPDAKALAASAQEDNEKNQSAASSSSSSKEEKRKKKKKKKGSKKKKKGKSKKKKKKQSSSSSSSEYLTKPSQIAGARISLDIDADAAGDSNLCPKGHVLTLVVIGFSTSGHSSHTCDVCRVSTASTGAKKIFRCSSCNYDKCRRCYAAVVAKVRAMVLGDGDGTSGFEEAMEANEDKPDSEAVIDRVDGQHSDELQNGSGKRQCPDEGQEGDSSKARKTISEVAAGADAEDASPSKSQSSPQKVKESLSKEELEARKLDQKRRVEAWKVEKSIARTKVDYSGAW